MLPVRGRDEQKGVSCGPPREGAPRGPPTFLGEGALHEPLTYLEEGAPQAPQAVWKKPCGNLQSAQEKRHPMAPQPTGKGAPHRLAQPTWQKEHPGDSQTPNLLWTTDTPCSLHLQDQEHPKNLPLQAPEAPPCPTGSQHCTPLAFTSLLEKKPQTEPKVPLWLPAPQGVSAWPRGARGPPTPAGGGTGWGVPERGPHGLTLFGWCPRGPGDPPSAPTRCGGRVMALGGTHAPPVRVLGGVHAHLWGAHLCCACGGGPGVHLHAGTHVCRRVRAGTRVGTGDTRLGGTCSRLRAGVCLKRVNVCIYINTNIYIYTVHTDTCACGRGLGGFCPRVTPACPSRPGGTCTGTAHACPYARVAPLA